MEFIAKRDCLITGHPGIVREGDRISLSRRAARYPRLKGWIQPAPVASPAPEPAAPRPRRRRQPKK